MSTWPPQALVLLNPAARGGRGRALWNRVASFVLGHLAPRVVETDPGMRWQLAVEQAIEEGFRIFIAAGGDGTVNALTETLVRAPRNCGLSEFTLGAVGLGSSNDFHKPYRQVVAGIPMKVSPDTACLRDVGLATYVDSLGAAHRRHFVVSASLGVTASANEFFNRGNRIQRWLKTRWTGAAILYAALHTIATCRNVAARISIDGREIDTAITNLSVLKTPYLSGSFCFDTPVGRDDGRFAVNLFENLTRPGALRALIELARGRFLGRPGRRHWRAADLSVECERPVALELDGEVVECRKVKFEVLAERIQECR